MNKEQAQKQIAELKAKVKELENNINGKYNPLAYKRKTEGYVYYKINDSGVVTGRTEVNSTDDDFCFTNGNYKQTFKQTERHAEYTRTLNRLLCIADELNEGWKPNWSDFGESKWHIYYDHHFHCGFVISETWHASDNKTHYKTRALANEALSRLDERDKAVLRGDV